MNLRCLLLLAGVGLAGAWEACTQAQPAPLFTRIQPVTNGEFAFTFAGEAGAYYRFEASTRLPDWSGLLTTLYTGNAPLNYTDSAAPFLEHRFYRAQQVPAAGVFTGDHLSTTNGEVTIQPRYHATLVLSWDGKTVYIDPDDAAAYPGLPKANLVLVTHSHSDHLSTATIDSVRATNAVIVATQDVYTKLTASQRTITQVLAYGESTNLLGLTVEAVAAYGPNHPFGLGNGYVLTLGGKRIYLSGDTGDTPEMHALPGIDAAFLSMNQPYSMTVSQATNAVTAFRPKVVYPYHYRDQSGATTNALFFKQQLSQELGIEVRLRNWY